MGKDIRTVALKNQAKTKTKKRRKQDANGLFDIKQVL